MSKKLLALYNQAFAYKLKIMPFNRKTRKFKNEVNAGSMADIAFLLLIFFLVTTKIVEEQGILVKLPPFTIEPFTQEVSENNVFTVKINMENQVLAENKIIKLADLKLAAKTFITNPNARLDRPSSPSNAVVSLQNDRGTDYHTYIAVYNELQAAYRELREEKAQEKYGKPFKILKKEAQNEIRLLIPLVISEAEPTEF